MQGRFDLTKIGSGGHSDADFERAVAVGKLDEMLVGLPVKQKCHGIQNRIFDNMAGYVLNKLFGLGNAGWPYYLAADGAPPAALSFISLLTTDGDTTNYEEDWGREGTNSNLPLHNSPNTANSSSAGKRFEEDQIEGWTIWTDSDREAIHFKNKWLYLPTQGTSTDIRSIGIYFQENGDGTGGYWEASALIGRVRLKDSSGNKIILTKNDSEVLLVEYTFTLVTV